MSQIKVEITLEMNVEEAQNPQKVEAGVNACANELRSGVEKALKKLTANKTAERPAAAVPSISILQGALQEYERRTGLIPRVALLAPWLYDKYEAEQRVLGAVMPESGRVRERDLVENGGVYADIRLLEDHRVQTIEVF